MTFCPAFCASFIFEGFPCIAGGVNTDHVVSIFTTLLLGHAHILQLAPCLLQSGRGGVVADGTVLQIVHPLLDGRLGHFVKAVNYQQEVFWHHFIGHCYPFRLGLDILPLVLSAELEH